MSITITTQNIEYVFYKKKHPIKILSMHLEKINFAAMCCVDLNVHTSGYT